MKKLYLFAEYDIEAVLNQIGCMEDKAREMRDEINELKAMDCNENHGKSVIDRLKGIENQSREIRDEARELHSVCRVFLSPDANLWDSNHFRNSIGQCPDLLLDTQRDNI